MSTRLTIPLWLVFTIQSVVVAGAFIAVILVLTLQQQDQYKTSVFNEIQLQHKVDKSALLTPILTRERATTQLAGRLIADPSMWFTKGDTLQSPNIQRFMNLTYFMMYQDPLAYAIYQFRLDPAKTVPDLGQNYSSHYGAAGISNDLIAGITNFNGSVFVAPNPTFPLQFSSFSQYPLEVKGTPSVTYKTPRWVDAAVYSNSITKNTKFVISLAYPIVFNTALGQSELVLYYSINIQYIVDIAASALLTPDSQSLLIERHSSLIISNINAGAPIYNKNGSEVWTIQTFPNQGIVTYFLSTNEKCNVEEHNCTHYSKEEDGDSIVSLHHMTTDYGFDISLFQITPRSHYFAAGERAMITGIVIGVVVAVIVILSCVIIWFAIRSPVHRLRESMDLAAVMRNDEVNDTGSILSELDLLSESFLQMNSKLLQARAFMPQAVLFGERENCSSGDSTDVSDADGGVVTTASNKPEPSEEEPQAAHITIRRGSSVVYEEDDVRSTTGSQGGVHSSAATHKNVTRRGIVILTEIHNLVPKNVAILILNARGTHALALSGGAGELEAEQVKLVELIQKCTRSGNGVVDAFQGDHFVITFNAVRAVGTPVISAARVALKIEERAQHEGLALGCFSMGLGGGRALVGNVGSATMKKSCTVGSVYTIAAGLEVLAKRVGRTCVTHGRCLSGLQHTTSIMLLGSAQLTATRQEVTGCIMSRPATESTSRHEWLYQFEATTTTRNSFDMFNTLVEKYVNEGVDAVERAIEDMASRGVDDSNVEGGGLFPPQAMSHLQTLMEKRRQIESMTGRELNALQMGQRRSLPYVDYDLFYPNV